MSGKVMASPWLLLAGSLALCGLILEVGVRQAGYSPWPDGPGLTGLPPELHEIDSQLGWRKRPGVFEVDRFGSRLQVTHWSRNRRATGPVETHRPSEVTLVGGSFLYGLGLSDPETFAWRLRDSLPDSGWVNLGTSAYGTYQALLSLEEYLAEGDSRPQWVIYAYSWFHAERNVAADSWQYAMAVSSPTVRLPLPYVWIDEHGELERGVHVYPNWPFKRHSAAVALAERAWNKLSVRGREGQESDVMQLLLLTMRDLAESRGARFLVMLLGRSDINEFLERQSIPHVDCKPPAYGPEMSLPDAHPSAVRNELYAECLGSYLTAEELSEDGP